jgi:hypothetical protein
MPITDGQLDQVIMGWNQYAEGRPESIDPNDVLVKRDLNMYRGLGIENITELSMRLVEDRSVASMEMTMGHLYERVLEALGPRKLTNAEKGMPGFRGLDFIQDTPLEHRLVNLKSALSTSNGDITTATVSNLSAAKAHWESDYGKDDNPLRSSPSEAVMIRAVARGQTKRVITGSGILWLVGDAMWDYFGGGRDLLRRLGAALGRNPLNFTAYTAQIEGAAYRVRRTLLRYELTGEEVDWDRLLARYP